MIFALPIIRQTDVETDSGNLRSKFLCPAEFFERAFPFLLAHVDYAEVSVRADISRRHGHNFEESLLRLRQLAAAHGRVAGLERLAAVSFGIDSLGGKRCDSPNPHNDQISFDDEPQSTMLALLGKWSALEFQGLSTGKLRFRPAPHMQQLMRLDF